MIAALPGLLPPAPAATGPAPAKPKSPEAAAQTEAKTPVAKAKPPGATPAEAQAATAPQDFDAHLAAAAPTTEGETLDGLPTLDLTADAAEAPAEGEAAEDLSAPEGGPEIAWLAPPLPSTPAVEGLRQSLIEADAPEAALPEAEMTLEAMRPPAASLAVVGAAEPPPLPDLTAPSGAEPEPLPTAPRLTAEAANPPEARLSPTPLSPSEVAGLQAKPPTATAEAAAEAANPPPGLAASEGPGQILAERPAAVLAAPPAAPARAAPPPLLRNVLDRLSEVEIAEGKTRLLLRPKGLGVLEIDIARQLGGRLQLVIRAENPLLLEALRQESGAMSAYLGERGFDLSGGEAELGRWRPPAAEAEAEGAAQALEEEPGADPSAPRSLLDGARLDLVT